MSRVKNYLGWISIVSLVLCVGCGSGSAGDKARNEIPRQVFGGGGGLLRLDLSLNQPGYLAANFEGSQEQKFDAEKELTPGDKSFEIDIPEDTYGYFEFEIPKATVGAELYWEIRLNGNLVGREKQRLDQPLENNSAFFLQFEFNDLSEVREQMKEPFIRGEGDNQ